jgi:TupA-like ATPgrasp
MVQALLDRLGSSLPDVVVEWISVLRRYRRRHGHLPNLFHPQTFNDKVIHRILFDRRPILTELTDKAAVRQYVTARGGSDLLPDVYYLTREPETIPFDELPDRFIVKPTHCSGWVEVVTDKPGIDREKLVALCHYWLGYSFYDVWRVPFYRNVEPQIIVEELIDDGNGLVPNDYKLHVFDGAVKLIQVDTGRFVDHRRRLYTPAWEQLDVRTQFPDAGDVPRPCHLERMIEAAEALSRGMDYVRADFYDTPHKLYIGELTMGSGGGLERFIPEEFNLQLGSFWKLP